LRWLAPSAVAACVGALAAGLVEGARTDGAASALAAAGFLAVLAVPALLVAGAVVRGVAAAWGAGELVRSLIDADGAAPRLAAWLAVILLGAFGLAAAMFHSVWLLSLYTAFKPLAMSFLEPAVAVATALAIVALSRPCARLLAWLAQRLDARWRRGGRGTLLRPRIIVAAAGLAALAALYGAWRMAVRYRLGPIDTGLLHVPAAGLAAAGLTHAAWPRLRRTGALVVGLGSALATAAALAVAAFVLAARPSSTLEIWGDRPLAGLAIETVFDTGAIRARIALAEFRPVERPGAAHPDIILVTIDTVRADHTPPYGGQADMPGLRDLAAHGTTFDWAFAPGNVTRRSIPSIATGLSPMRVRGRVVGWALRLDPRHVLLAERLRGGGYDTAGFMCCEGFWGQTFRTGLERGLAHLVIDHRGQSLAGKARAWLDAREQRAGNPPLFLWMHLIEPHNWTQPTGEPKSDADRRAFYDRALAAADQMVRDMLAAFGRRPPERAPIVIVTADHGEALGEHGQPFHSTDLYNSQIRVPLVIAGPGIRPQHIAETVSLTDLVPTILDLAGFVPPRGRSLDGRSLAELATGARAADPEGGIAFAAMIKDRSNPGGVTAVVKGRWKLIDSGDNQELYDVRTDPGEHNNVLGQQPRLLDELRKLLAERTAAAADSPFE
jgi:arylsulfatase A-like enzyme